MLGSDVASTLVQGLGCLLPPMNSDGLSWCSSPLGLHCLSVINARAEDVTSGYHGCASTDVTGLFVGVCHGWNGPRWRALISLAGLLPNGPRFGLFFSRGDYLS